MKKITCALFIATLLISCHSKQRADLIVLNATIYTVDSAFSTVQAMAVRDGKNIATGTNDEINNTYDGEKIDAKDKFIYPGFIDAHTHFYRYGLGLQTADLVGTKSWNEIVEKLKTFATQQPDGWIIGRGWDQND